MTGWRDPMRRIVIVFLAGLVSGWLVPDARATETETYALADRLTPALLQQVFPGAGSFVPSPGSPPTVEVFRKGDTAGYVLSVGDLVEPSGYSGRPFEILLGLDIDALVTGAVLIDAEEPLLRAIHGERPLAETIARLVGLDVLAVEPWAPTGFAGRGEASALAMLDAIYRAGRAVAVAKELRGPGEREGRRLDMLTYRALDWLALRAMGAVKRLALSPGDLGEGAPFAEFFAGLATPALTGRNLLGDDGYANALAALDPGDQIVLVAMNGLAADATAVRLGLRQGGRTHAINGAVLPAAGIVTDGAPAMARVVLSRLTEFSGFDATRPWTLEVRVGAAVFGLPYIPPPALVIEPIPHMVAVADNRKAEALPLWVSVWWDQRVRIGVLAVALVALSVILLLQGKLARHARLLAWVRGGFLTFTLVWIGWVAGAQVSVMHVLILAKVPFDGGGLGAMALDPLTVMVMAFAGLGLLLLGRGVFCGWLCPFGALQELLNRCARLLKVPQVRLPMRLNARLWAVKYGVVLALLALAFIDVGRGARAVEIEPFNTAIMLPFMRAWPYTVFALVVLGVGLFVERFFCRYLCPLGGALAVLGRWHVLHWFKRRHECGRDCDLCQPLCPVQAIGDDGKINLAECTHCLACQTAYYDDRLCPPLVARRERLERLSAGQ